MKLTSLWRARSASAPSVFPDPALLDGVIDIYMPDMKYGDSDTARKYSQAPNDMEVNQRR